MSTLLFIMFGVGNIGYLGQVNSAALAGASPPATFFLTSDSGVRLTNDAGTARILTQ